MVLRILPKGKYIFQNYIMNHMNSRKPCKPTAWMEYPALSLQLVWQKKMTFGMIEKAAVHDMNIRV